MNNRLNLWTALELFAVILLLAACNTTTFPLELLLSEQEIPDSYNQGIEISETEEFIQGRIWFSRDPDIGVVILHKLIIYPDTQTAAEAYPGWEQDTFSPGEWLPTDYFTFSPSAPEDQSRFACLGGLDSSANFAVCGYTQQHDNLISVMWVNLDGESMYLWRFEDILAILDTRMNEYTGTPGHPA